MTTTPAATFAAQDDGTLTTVPATAELATTETAITWAFDATKRLAAEGEGATVASAVAEMLTFDATELAPDGAIVGGPTVASPLVTVTLDGSVLLIGRRYKLVVTYTSSAGNTEAMELEVYVPF